MKSMLMVERGSPAKELAMEPPIVWGMPSVSRTWATESAIAIGSAGTLTEDPK
jgi:hypothetical protein